MLDSGQCDVARESIGALLERQPDNAEAQNLRAELEKCTPPLPVVSGPTPRPRPQVQLAQAVSADEGGLEPVPGETDRDYQTRIKAMRERYDNAVAMAAKGPSREVISLFEGIVRDATPRYLDVSTQLANARRAYRATAQKILTDARNLASNEKWNE